MEEILGQDTYVLIDQLQNRSLLEDSTGMDYLIKSNQQGYLHAPVKCVDVKELLRIMGEEV